MDQQTDQIITHHKYLDKHPISPDSKKLILGTIHPHDTGKFQMEFFYGNQNSIWHLLSDAFPKELSKPLTVEKVLHFLQNRRIAVSDTIKRCKRTSSKAEDNDLIPELLNYDLREQIRYSHIEEILCTSGFGKNNAFKLFYKDILGLTITPEIRKSRQVLLDKSIFGRPVLIKILYSPSGAANIALSQSVIYLANKDIYKQYDKPVYQFKVNYYREQFSDK